MFKRTLVLFLMGAALLVGLLLMLFAPAPYNAHAQGPTPAPAPPVAKLQSIGMPANILLTGAVTSTYTYITDTQVGKVTGTTPLGTSGLSNVPINVPVFVQVSPADPKNSGKPTWSLTAPPGSKATITSVTAITTAMVAKFTPDVVGAYYVSASLKNDAGLTSNTDYVFFNAGTYIGVTAGNCVQCHKNKVDEWSKTGHASILKANIDNTITPNADTHYTESCAKCHTVGYFLPAPGNGGFADVEAKTGWTVPTWDKINAAGKKTGPSNWDAAPAEIKNMGNVQCENCHGPANEHVKNGADVMAVSFRNDACNSCHSGFAGGHIKGIEILNSKHYTGSSFEEVNGPARQACVRCHSGSGYASFTANPKNPAAWNNEENYVGCAACHDPHSDANYAQLRVVGKPVEVPFADKAKDVGLSGTCETCHNDRVNSDDFAAGKTTSYPHYSSAAEMLSDLGGITYGQTVPNSIHGAFVGVAAVPNPTTPGTFLWSASTDTKGNVPGPCVYCHMYPTTATNDPNYMKVGEHSFNTLSPDGKYDYLASCNSAGCHKASPLTTFNRPAAADYDGNGKVEGDQDEIKGLLNVLWKQLEAKGWKKLTSGYPYATIPQSADAKQKNAWFNFSYVYGVMWSDTSDGNQGAAAAVHNLKRSCALLQLSLKDLNGSLPAGMADCTK